MAVVRYQRAALAALAMLFGTANLAAQQVQGRIHGLVLDSSGAVVGGAEVEVRRIETGATRHASSGANGRYSIPALSPGSYSVGVSAEGFRARLQRSGPALDRRRGRCQLRAGGRSRERRDHRVRRIIGPRRHPGSDRQRDPQSLCRPALPLNGRNFLQLSLLVPGTAPAAVGSPGSERGRFAFQTNSVPASRPTRSCMTAPTRLTRS